MKLQPKRVITWAIEVPIAIMKVLGRPILQEIPLEHGVLDLRITPYPQKSQKIHIITRLMKHEKDTCKGKTTLFHGMLKDLRGTKMGGKILLSTYKQHVLSPPHLHTINPRSCY